MLWTELIDPATLTGYARKSLEDYERRKGTLAKYLPNKTVDDIVVRFNVTQNGLVEAAKYRAYDAEPEIGKGEGGKRVVLELPALGQNIPISELDQLRSRNASEEAQIKSITKATDRVVQSVADRLDYQRGVALLTGVGTIDQDNFRAADNFGRSGTHSVIAGTPWTDTTVDRIALLEAWCDIYEDTNGERPGSIAMSRAVFRAFRAGDQFQTQLINGGARRPTDGEVTAIIEGEGLPPIDINNRKVKVNGTTQYTLGQDSLLLLPEPVGVDEPEATDLGASFWGRTLTADDPDWGLADGDDAAGIVCGVYRNKKPPMITEVISDAIGLAVLANANLSFRAKVL